MSFLTIEGLAKIYDGGHQALHPIDLSVKRGEIFALLGPNGAGKTTLISTICGLVVPSAGRAMVAGFDTVKDYKKARALVGLVPQELAVDGFENVMNALRYSRALFGKPKNDAYLEEILENLALGEKRDAPVVYLSGGMKRRVLIAKALAHEPELLFLDEPTAGVDVSLRKDLWAMVRRLRDRGTTIVLTTHYIDEAEELADRIGVINHGCIILVEEKRALMQRLGKKEIVLTLTQPLDAIPAPLGAYALELRDGALVYQFSTTGQRIGVHSLLHAVSDAGLAVVDVDTRQSKLEDIFVDLVSQ